MEQQKLVKDATTTRFKKAIQALQDPLYGQESQGYREVGSIIKKLDIFQRKLETPSKLHDFIDLITPLLKYEVHPYGSVLIRDKEPAKALHIILQGTAHKLHQRTVSKIDAETTTFQSRGTSNPKTSVEHFQKSHPPNCTEEAEETAENLEKVKRKRRSTLISNQKRGSKFFELQEDASSLVQDDVKFEEKVPIKRKSCIRINGVEHSELAFGLDQVQKLRRVSYRSCKDDKSNSDLSVNNLQEDNGTMIKFPEVSSFKRVSTMFASANHLIAPKFNPSQAQTDTKAADSEDDSDSSDGEEYEEDIATLLLKKDNESFIRYVAHKNPDIKNRCLIGESLRVAVTKTFGVGEYFGETFHKEQQKETSIIAVSSDEAHVLSMSRESYQSVILALKIGLEEKLVLFEEIFPSDNQEVVKILAQHFGQKTLKKGETVYNQNDEANSLYLVKSGEVRLTKDSEASPVKKILPITNKLLNSPSFRKLKQLSVANVTKGQFFGEEPLLGHSHRHLTAQAVSSETVVFIMKKPELLSNNEDLKPIMACLRNQAREREEWRQQRVAELSDQSSPVMPKNPAKLLSPTQGLEPIRKNISAAPKLRQGPVREAQGLRFTWRDDEISNAGLPIIEKSSFCDQKAQKTTPGMFRDASVGDSRPQKQSSFIQSCDNDKKSFSRKLVAIALNREESSTPTTAANSPEKSENTSKIPPFSKEVIRRKVLAASSERQGVYSPLLKIDSPTVDSPKSVLDCKIDSPLAMKIIRKYKKTLPAHQKNDKKEPFINITQLNKSSSAVNLTEPTRVIFLTTQNTSTFFNNSRPKN